MIRKLLVLVSALAAVALGQAIAPPAAEAAPGLTPASTTVAAGARLFVGVSDCVTEEQVDGDTFAFQEPEVVLITGSGASARLAGVLVAEYVTVPGWVDPDEPAVLTGRCVQTRYHPDGTVSRTVSATFPEVALDITPAVGTPAAPTMALSRTTAAGGQVVQVTATGCAGFESVRTLLLTGANLDGRALFEFLGGAQAPVRADGSATMELDLNALGEGEDTPGPLPEGAYTAVALCTRYDAQRRPVLVFTEPQRLDVVGTNPSGSLALDRDEASGDLLISGVGCTDGRTVRVTLRGAFDDDLNRAVSADRRARASGSVARVVATRAIPSADPLDEELTVTPAADGSWSLTWTPPAEEFDLVVTADCGDPLADGFRYGIRYWFEYDFSDAWVERVSPTSSPVGGPITVHLSAMCDDGEAITAVLLTADERVVAESAPTQLNDYDLGRASLTAPATPGTYLLGAACDGDLSYAEEYEVFAPTPVAADGPLPAHPTIGWPDAGQRATYHGKIGPISVPGMEMGEMEMDGRARDLGPSELFIDVPRPEGDLAITKITFDLVDATGQPVAKDSVHLHHLVIGNGAKKNPACPDGTFGLPGQIVAAAGAERTAMTLPDPYGLVVDASDSWHGVYDLMSMVEHDQTVYLTYDLEYRRDVENVRPVETYFGSATGCGSFTWTVDGSGTPDVQQHYLTLPKAGRLVAAGAHIHNGGASADLVDDRGRTLCRSTLELGDEPVHGMGHGAGHDRGPLSEVGDFEYPPEFYDDDLQIEAINGCALAERVTAGQRVRFDASYTNDRARSGVMGIYTLAVWEGGGPAEPTTTAPPGGARPIPGRPNYTG